MKKTVAALFLLSTFTLFSQSADAAKAAEAPQPSLSSDCGITGNESKLNNAHKYNSLIKIYSTSNKSDSLASQISGDSKVACSAVLEAAFKKGLVGNNDKIQKLVVNLERNKNGSYKYKASVGIYDYKSKSRTYNPRPRLEHINGKFDALPIMPPVTPPVILGEPPRT